MEDWIKERIIDSIYIFSGIVLFVIGVILLFIPGPGILFFALAILLLARRFIVFKKPADKITNFLKRFKRKKKMRKINNTK